MHFFKAFIIFAGLFFPLSSFAAQDIPVKRVVISTSGLAFFEHSAVVKGDTVLHFPTRLDHVNDVLKSLLIFDPKGQLSHVQLPGKEPLTQTFRNLPFTQAQLNDPVALLNAYQGTTIKIKDSGQTLEGILIRVIPEHNIIDDSETTRNRVTFIGQNGLKSVLLENIQSIELTDPKAMQDIQFALNAVREHSQSEQRQFKISLTGTMQRDVTLSYVVPTPLWKTAYRLVLPEKGQDTGYIQGWAIVENMTGSDWNDVQLTLTSGNPVTLQQDLYPSYYTSRPFIPVEVFGRVMPRLDQGSIALAKTAQSPKRARLERRQQGARFNAFADAEALAESLDAPAFAQGSSGHARSSTLELAQIQHAAQSSDTTAQVLFNFPGRFDLQSGQTMMLPFVNQKLPMETVALYQPDRHKSHPFLSVSIKNTGNNGLPPGILTLYAQDTTGMHFVGDAQLALLPKTEKRLVSYALDNLTKVDREFKNNQVHNQITASEGVMRTSVKYRNEAIYTIKAPAEEKRTVMIEHPRQSGYDLISPKTDDIEVTDTHYRLKVPVAKGETIKTSVILERAAWESIRIDTLSLQDLKAYAKSRGKLDKQTRKIFAELAQRRQDMAATEQKINGFTQRRQEIYRDQNRIRENIKSLSGNSNLKNRYLEQLDDQEDLLEDLNKNLETTRKHLETQRQKLQNYIRTIKF